MKEKKHFLFSYEFYRVEFFDREAVKEIKYKLVIAKNESEAIAAISDNIKQTYPEPRFERDHIFIHMSIASITNETL